MQISLTDRSEAATYHLLTQTIIPRPIAWVLTADATVGPSHLNIAPFSFFAPVASDPPLLAFSIGNRLAGREKDTSRNTVVGAPVVVHIPDTSQAAAVQVSARETSHEVSELEEIGEGASLDHDWDFALPRLAICPVAYGCTVRQRLDLVAEQGQQVLVIVEAKLAWVRDDAHETDERGRARFNPALIDPLSRLGSGRFARSAPRP